MTVIDCTAFCGPYSRRPIGMEPTALSQRLAALGVAQFHASRLEALWFENSHDANRLAESLPDPPGFRQTPVLDPSIATWREELDRLSRRGPLLMVRLHPNYHGYSLPQADPALAELEKRGVVAQVVVRVDDPRRQHPLAQVPDVPAGAVREAAARHPSLRVLLSGAQAPALNSLTRELPHVPNLWADTAQVDGVDAIASLARTAWADRLVFGSQAPILILEAALARVVLDLDDAQAERILSTNPAALLAKPAR
jgi:predicted TIM-barrel fold metal-dependent hydrolase